MTDSLHRHIGAIRFKCPTIPGIGKGSGLLISPNLVLTCGHNVYRRQTRQKHVQIKFYPGLNGPLKDEYEA